MRKLPDLEGLAIFAKVSECGSFSKAALELDLSKATVSKAIGRLEARFKVPLFSRTSRRISLTDAGAQLAVRAANLLAESQAAEDMVLGHSAVPRGLVRLSAPVSFGTLFVAPLLPEFFKAFPEINIDLQMSDSVVDLVGDGFDAAIRIASLPDSSLVARTLVPMPLFLVAAPSYLRRHGEPSHPSELVEHTCIAHARSGHPDAWHFHGRSGEIETVRPAGCLRTNNGDAMMPALLAGTALAVLPEFFLRDAFATGQLQVVLPEWHLPSGAVHWITPPGRLRPKRVDILGDFLGKRLVGKLTQKLTAAAAGSRNRR